MPRFRLSLSQQGLLWIVHLAAAGIAERLQLGVVAVAEQHSLLTLALEGEMGQPPLGKVDPFSFAAELQQWAVVSPPVCGRHRASSGRGPTPASAKRTWAPVRLANVDRLTLL